MQTLARCPATGKPPPAALAKAAAVLTPMDALPRCTVKVRHDEELLLDVHTGGVYWRNDRRRLDISQTTPGDACQALGWLYTPGIETVP